MNRYTFRVQWSLEEHQYVGRCVELPFLSRGAPTAREALAAASDAVDEHLRALAESDLQPPEPLTERRYSGKFIVRTSPALHERLAIEAAEEQISMNQLVVQKLSGRPLGGGLSAFLFD
ncbi:type II toxin-antitoxin system HicB family antitoxin [Mycobacterium angelicum]|uniref:Pilus assembly protein HicB n=1 Tax=Mycobacterium angelicum TaxID=470074 RepID=A0A1W9ZEZ8_MYCAN|nr:type II toxin-antitoxin system HicB family antitoxin [Mycobacterium angelicum]MCV7198444.1 type II toxin-antitoxin system HicB family antitoxin [Mycobacterium angelicum]ORA13728.1 pilus assembly protein HicB [Mycobacterium angelicum]